MDPEYPSAPPKPNNHLVWAILTTVLCCLPFGIPAIIFASQVDGKYASGDYQGAEESSRKAKTWSLVAGITGGVGILLYIVLVGFVAANGAFETI
jgi:hypothetical protein